MVFISLVAIFTSVLFLVAYTHCIQHGVVNKNNMNQTKEKGSIIFYFLAICLVIRVMACMIYSGHTTDLNCFDTWARLVVENGYAKFYSSEVFADYPPGYIYILSVVGGILKLFDLPTISSGGSAGTILVIKAPAILCDIATGYLIYKIAKKKLNETSSLMCTAIYLFNPAIFINSTVWGQVDSVYTLFIVLSMFFLVEKKYGKAIIIFILGVMIKPQTLIFAPVFGFVCLEETFLQYENGIRSLCFKPKKLFCFIKWALLGGLLFIILCMPYGLENVFSQYMSTIGSYKYASVNAYNFWALVDLNWIDQSNTFLGIAYSTYGYIFIMLTVIVAAVLYFRSQREPSRIFMSAAFINIGIFLFSVRMHERYMFPSLTLLLIAFLYKPKKESMLLYWAFSIVNFFNVAYVLMTYPDLFSWDDIVPNMIGGIAIVIFLFYLVMLYKFYFKKQKEISNKKDDLILYSSQKESASKVGTIMKTESISKMTKKDYLLMILITCAYAVVALYDLGSNVAPETSWESSEMYDEINLDLGTEKEISQIEYFNGNYENREFEVYCRNSEDEDWEVLSADNDFKMNEVFKWNHWDVNINCRYLKIVSLKEVCVIKELLLIDGEGKNIMPVNAAEYANLFDEQDTFTGDESFRTGTYFDEIYHARTAYEYIHRLYSYENTHPPLGKIFISLGMLLFGENPFGWRIIGTLFGVAMLPLIYLFGKRMFKKTWLASIVCFLFAVDFMHFAQTRIATIDVYITFFIIAMYYFMYRYVTMSFYDTPLKKTFGPLLCCGISVGLGIASKVTGAYAALGLAIIFFTHLYRRYQEYLYAKKDPEGMTNGIKHKEVIDHFGEYTWKTILFCVVCFIIIPIVIFTLAYLPFINREGEGLVERMMENIVTMFNYHTKLNATHSFSSWWYEWPIMTRPIWYYDGEISSTMAQGISSFGNPLIWWVGIPAFFYTVYLWIGKKDKKAAFLSIAFLAEYLPWVPVTRITYIYHYFPSVPFIILMIAYAIYHIVKTKPKMKYAVIGYLAACLLLFVMFYPVLSGQTISKEYVDHYLKWFDSWVLLRTW